MEGIGRLQRGASLAEGCKPGRRVQTWQKGANLAEGCKPGRRVQTWQKGANLAEGCKPGRRVQTCSENLEDSEPRGAQCGRRSRVVALFARLARYAAWSSEFLGDNATS